MRFSGKTAFITGGGTGIGAAVARRIANEGGKVALIGRRLEPLEAGRLRNRRSAYFRRDAAFQDLR